VTSFLSGLAADAEGIVKPIGNAISAATTAEIANAKGDAKAGAAVAGDVGSAVKSVATDVASGAKSVWSWAEFFSSANLANLSLIGVGVVMGLGALLLAQKETIVKVANTAAKVSTLLS